MHTVCPHVHADCQCLGVFTLQIPRFWEERWNRGQDLSLTILLPSFLKKKPCMMTLLASWLLQNYFTAQFNSRVRTYFLPPREKPKQDHLSGVPHTSQEPPELQPSLGRIFQIPLPCRQTHFTKTQLLSSLSSFRNKEHIRAYDLRHVFSTPYIPELFEVVFQLYVYTGGLTVTHPTAIQFCFCLDRSRDRLHHCGPTTAQTLQAGFLHEEIAIIQTWSNHNGKRCDTQNIGGLHRKNSSLPGTQGYPRVVTESGKYTLISD